MSKRLFRSRYEKIWAGVCGGLANYFDVDPVIVRLIVVLSFFLSGGITFLLYLACIFVVPKEPLYPINNRWEQGQGNGMPPNEVRQEPMETGSENDIPPHFGEQPISKPLDQNGNSGTKNMIGIILVALGGILLLRNVFSFLENVSLFPIVLIIVGVWMLVSYQKKGVNK